MLKSKKNHNLSKLAVALTVALALPTQAQAATEQSTEVKEDNQLEVIMVTAQKRVQSVK